MSNDGGRNHRPRATNRRILPRLILVAAALATIATSQVQPSLRIDHEGTPFDLSSTTREVRIPFEFEASQVVQDQDRWAARFRLRVTWEGVSVDDRELRAYIREDEEASPDWSSPTFIAVSCAKECLGGGTLVVEWPEHLATGSATVDWEAWAEADFETSSLPEGASIDFEVLDEVTPSRWRILVEDMIGHELGLPEQPLQRRIVDIVTEDAEAVYRLDMIEQTLEGRAWFYAIVGNERIDMVDGDTLLLTAPEGCALPCEWSFEVVLTDDIERRNSPRTWWRLRQSADTAASTVEVTQSSESSDQS